MAGASANRFQLIYAEEAVPGTRETTGFQTLRITDESLTKNVGTIVSNELRADRQVPDTIQTEDDAAGAIRGELSYGAYDDLFRGALYHGASWEAAATASGISGVTINSSGAVSGTGVSTGHEVGDFVRIEDSGAGDNRGKIGRVASIGDADNMVINCADLVTEGSGTITFQKLDYIEIGTTEIAFSMEKQYGDVSLYTPLNGVQIDTLRFAVSTGAIITVEFGCVGRELNTTDASGDATSGVLGTGKVMSPISNATLAIGGTVQDVLTDFSVDIGNSAAPRRVIGQLGAESIRIGRSSVGGTLSALFEDATLVNIFEDQTETNACIIFNDQDLSGGATESGNVYVVDMPRVKFTTGSASAPGIDTDVPLEVGFQSIYDTDLARSLRIWKIDAA